MRRTPSTSGTRSAKQLSSKEVWYKAASDVTEDAKQYTLALGNPTDKIVDRKEGVHKFQVTP